MAAEEPKTSAMKAFMMPVRMSQGGSVTAAVQKVVQPKVEMNPSTGQIAGTHRVFSSSGTDPNNQNTIIIIPAGNVAGEHGDGQSVTYQILPQASPIKTTTATPGRVQVQIQQPQQPKPAAKSPHPALAQVRRVIQGNMGTPGGGDMSAIMKVQKEPARAPDVDPALLMSIDPKKQSKDQRTLTLPPVSMESLETTNLCIEIEVDDALSVGELDSCKLKNGKTKYFFKISKVKIPLKAERFGVTPRSNPRVTIIPSKRKNVDIDYEEEEFEEMELEQTPSIVRKALKKMKLDKSEGEEEESEEDEEEKEKEDEEEEEDVKPVKASEMKDDGTFDENDENFDASVGDDDDDFEEEVNETEEVDEEEEDEEEEETKRKRMTARKGKKSVKKTAKKNAPKKRAAIRIVKEKPLIEEVTYSPEVKSLTKAVPKGLLDDEGTPKRSYFRTNAYAKNDKFVVIRDGDVNGGKPMLVCKECGFQTSHQTSMSGHLNRHANLRPFFCALCNKGFKDQSNLNSHLQNVHADSRDFVCDICNGTFKTKRSLTVHNERHFPGKKTYVCDTCGKSFNHVSSLYIHKRIHKEKTFQCKHCEKTFYTTSDLSRHEFTHTGVGKHQCHICGKSFYRLVYWRDHMTKRHDLTKVEKKKSRDGLKVPVEEEPGTSSSGLETSQAMATIEMTDQKNENADSRDFVCDVCGGTFKTKRSLTVHYKQHLPSNKSYVCDACGKSFNNVSSLNDHKRTHGEKAYQCEQCEKSFYLKSDLSRHEFTHTRVGKHQCHICEESFCRLKRWRDHMMKKHYVMDVQRYKPGDVINIPVQDEPETSSSGQETSHAVATENEDADSRDFVCDVCGGTFKTKRSLTVHYKQHLPNNKTFECDTCGKSFNKVSRLKNHKRRHGEKAYQCEQCEKSFYLKSDLSRHEFTHTRVGKHQCHICGMSFCRLKHWRKHMEQHESMDVQKNEPGDLLNIPVQDEPETSSSELETSQAAATENEHAKSWDFVCDVCNGTFKTKRHLSFHYKQHFSGNTTYICDACGKSFSNVSSINDHKRTHGEKAYQCKYCEKSFYLKTDLSRHEFIHTGVSKHQCHICSKSFCRLDHLHDHLKKQHDIILVQKRKPRGLKVPIQEEPGASSSVLETSQAAATIEMVNQEVIEEAVFDLLDL